MKDLHLNLLVGWCVRPLFLGMITVGALLIVLVPFPWDSQLLRSLPNSEPAFTAAYLATCWSIGIFVITCFAVVKIIRDLWRCMGALP